MAIVAVSVVPIGTGTTSVSSYVAGAEKVLREECAELAPDGAPALTSGERARLTRRLAHVPIKGLRALAREYGPDAAEVFLAETGLKP